MSIKTTSTSPFTSPSSLMNLSPQQANRLHEYIQAIERQNNSFISQRASMQRYMDSLRQQMEQMSQAQKNRKNKEVFYNSQIYRLSHDNMLILSQLRARDQRIIQLQHRLQQYKTVHLDLRNLRHTLQNDHQSKLATLSSQLSSTNNMHSQMATLSMTLNSITAELANYKNMYTQAIGNVQKLKIENNGLEGQLKRVNQEIMEIRDGGLRDNKQLERVSAKLVQEVKEKQKMQTKLHKFRQAYDQQSKIWENRQKQLQQFIQFITNNIKGLQSTIERQNHEMELLRNTSIKLKSELIQNISKLTEQSDKDIQIASVRGELAACKGKLAQKQRQLIKFLDRNHTLQDDQYGMSSVSIDNFVYRKFKTQTIENLRGSSTDSIALSENIRKNSHDNKRKEKNGKVNGTSQKSAVDN